MSRQTTTKHAYSFAAVNKQGDLYTLDVFKKTIDVGNPVAPHAEYTQDDSMATIMTRDGQHVNRQEKGKYQIAATGEILRSTDPKAI
jgi:hypothetical protein